MAKSLLCELPHNRPKKEAVSVALETSRGFQTLLLTGLKDLDFKMNLLSSEQSEHLVSCSVATIHCLHQCTRRLYSQCVPSINCRFYLDGVKRLLNLQIISTTRT